MPIYKFIHTQDDWVQTNLTNKSFDNTWFKVEGSGKIIIKGSHGNGYAWDGCSPKWKLFGRIIGTPDGKIDPTINRPKTYYASIFHDAIYQHKNAEDHYICLFIADNKNHFVRGRLSDLETELPPNFIRIHRSYIINRNYVKSFSGDQIQLINGERIPIGRTYRKKMIINSLLKLFKREGDCVGLKHETTIGPFNGFFNAAIVGTK